MNVFLGFDRLAAHFGPGILAVTLVDGLTRHGHRVTVFVDEHVSSENQYVRGFEQAGATVITSGRLATAAAGWLRIETLLLALLVPVRVPLALLDMLLRRRSPARAWHGVRGRFNRLVPQGPLWRTERAAIARRMSRAHRRQPADVLHMLTGVGAGFAWAAARGVPIIYNENIVPSPEFGVAWWDDVREHADRVALTVAICAAAEPGIRGFLGYGGPLTVIPNTIADPLANGSGASLRAAAAGVCVLGCAARLSAVKGIDVLMHALAGIAAPANGPAVQVWIAGDGPERVPLERLAQRLGVLDRVRFLGPLDAAGMAEFWGAIDVLVLPSRWEGLPLVILEAMAYGKPVVATAVDGIPEAVRDGETGLLVPLDAAEPLAAALATLAADPERRAAMGRAGRARFLRKFCADVTLDRWLAAYASVLGEPAPGARTAAGGV